MSKKFWISVSVAAGILFACFLTITIVLSINGFAPLPIDTAVANWAYSVRGEKGGATYWFFRIITEFGYLYFTLFIIILMAIIWKFRSKTWFFAGTILVSWLLQQLIKAIVMRPRPDEALWWMTEGSSSFPSGHSITVACIFVLLAYFVISSPAIKTWVKYMIGTLSVAAIILVPISRIIMGVHYFTDVMAGLFFGALIAVLGIIAYNLFISYQNKKQNKIDENSQKNNQKSNFIPPKISNE